MPTYRNISPGPLETRTTDNAPVTVPPGALVSTYRVLGVGWEKVDDEPVMAWIALRQTVTAPGSVSGLLGLAVITLVADTDGIVVSANASSAEGGYTLSKGVPVAIDNDKDIDSLHFSGAGKVLVQAGDGIGHGPAAVLLRAPRSKRVVPPSQDPAYPSTLRLLWRSTRPARSIIGKDPQFTGAPSVDAGGVAPGHGPDFGVPPELAALGTLAVRFTATKASSALTAEEQVFGPVYVGPEGLVTKIGANKATFATAWSAGDVVTAIVQVWAGKMRVGRG